MTLYDKILAIYPSLIIEDFIFPKGTIVLQNDGNGDFIAKWEHPTLTQPTEDRLNAI